MNQSYNPESMESMYTRLRNSSSGAQVEAVMKGISAIKKAGGQLDRENRMAALFHLTAALTGDQEGVPAVLEDISFTLNSDDSDDSD